ncbi:hypothetical protein RL72_00759 [Microbacterium azadirachtae]|uniref:Uncharacterized protein n=1 Tax=Microbacterium azadirachtae TaxID=582680 RepID=A0A0F0L3V9_9MICO|nr:hypothetical protein RL72_00759 [Microbacterium azadirachtae]
MGRRARPRRRARPGRRARPTNGAARPPPRRALRPTWFPGRPCTGSASARASPWHPWLSSARRSPSPLPRTRSRRIGARPRRRAWPPRWRRSSPRCGPTPLDPRARRRRSSRRRRCSPRIPTSPRAPPRVCAPRASPPPVPSGTRPRRRPGCCATSAGAWRSASPTCAACATASWRGSPEPTCRGSPIALSRSCSWRGIWPPRRPRLSGAAGASRSSPRRAGPPRTPRSWRAPSASPRWSEPPERPPSPRRPWCSSTARAGPCSWTRRSGSAPRPPRIHPSSTAADSSPTGRP